ncbi:DUF3103 family protein [Luteibacter sp. 3190]|uniref:DUF3103 family protein n=1 Tax=Luteibacter sp. 3190 TaxID=2817736 RepID=UPI00285664F8|nr:DUF3103 family protein [Luteibacter sp. 3190]MDR6936835.1 hypothetical protein [Luteibacter sp. 3190]
MKRILKATALAASLAMSLPAMAGDRQAIGDVRENAAKQLAELLDDQTFAAALKENLGKQRTPLVDVIRSYRNHDGTAARGDSTAALRDLERQATRLRGLDGRIDGLLNLRVLGAHGAARTIDPSDFWTAAKTVDATTGQEQLVAFDPDGKPHRYAMDAIPDVPMLVVDTNSPEATRAGIAMVNETLRDLGLQGPEPDEVTTGDEDLTVLKEIHLAYDGEHDSVTEGLTRSEVYAIVNGVGHDGKANVVFKDMPWLAYDKVWYTPGQDLINWREFSSNYVGFTLYEKDDTDFKEVASAVAGAVSQLSAFGGPYALPITVVSGMTKAIIDAMPNRWLRNDDDYLDSFYVIEKGKDYGTRAKPRKGAANNASIVLEPYTVKGR